MRLVVLSAFALGMALAAGGVQAQGSPTCDQKYEELLKKLTARSMPSDQRADYNAELLGAYQRCRAGGATQEWMGIENKINA
jgi:hypothetical protein